MSKFGGWSQFGSSQFGGQLSWSERYYRILKSIFLPGFWSLDDETRGNKLLRGDAKQLELGQLRTNALEREVFPHEASEDLPEWEALLGVVPRAGATINERRTAVVSKWRGAKPSTLRAIAEALADVLRCEWAWRDDFEDATLNYHYQVVNAAASESAGVLGLNLSADSSWPDDALRFLLRCNDPYGDVALYAQIDSSTIVSSSGDDSYGLMAYADDDNAIGLCIHDSGGSHFLRVDRLEGGLWYEDALGGAMAEPAAPYWLCLARQGAEWVFSTGPALDALTEYGRVPGASSLRIAKLGIYARNAAGSSDIGSLGIGELRVQHAAAWANVTIRELTRLQATLAELYPERGDGVFTGFIRRHPLDAGSYDLQNAQRVADRMAQAHTLLTIGETDAFACDDPYSQCNRDVLGA